MVIPFVGEQEIQDIARAAYAGLRSEIPNQFVFVTVHSKRNVEVRFSFPGGSYQVFNADLANKIAYEGSLNLEESWRGRGLGRKLAVAREEICSKLGVDLVVINKNENDSFWAHMGYKRIGFFSQGVKRRAVNAGVFLSYSQYAPRYKIIKLSPKGFEPSTH